MVLKLDHISLSCGCGNEYKEKIPENYKKRFEEFDLPNIDCKKEFLKLMSPVHNIFMYDDESNGIPIEVTQYPEVISQVSNISFEERTIYWPVKDITAGIELFTLLGGKVSENSTEVVFKPFLDKVAFSICFTETKENEVSVLDKNGYTSVGIFVDNVLREIEKMAVKGFEVTQINTLMVDNKKMDIGFIRGKNGEIVELIALSKR